MSDQATRADHLANTTELARSTAKALSGAVGASVFAYLLGWDYAFSYFGACGAPWILPKLGPGHLLSLSWLPAFQAFAVVSLTFSGAIYSDYRGQPFVASRKYENTLAALTGLLLLTSFIADKFLVEAVALALWTLTFTALSSLSAIIILDLIHKAPDRRWRHRTALGILMLLSLMHLTIFAAATSMAHRDFSPSRSSLPVATDDHGAQSRLVLVFDDQGLLATLASTPASTRFHVSPLNSLSIVQKRP
jgi:hypothetical protein